MTSRHEWAHQIIAKGKYNPNVQNFTLFLIWCEAEGTTARFNPLGCVQSVPGATDFNATGVKNYVSLIQGVDMTIKTLRNGKYPEILKCLIKGEDAIFTMAAIQDSVWGTHFESPASFVKNVRADWARYAFKSIPEG